MTRKLSTILLFLSMLGLGFPASAMSSTLLDGRYQTFDSDQAYRVANNLTQNNKSETIDYEQCHTFFDIAANHLTYDTDVDPSFDEKCMSVNASQGLNWVWYQSALDEDWSWATGEGADGPLNTNFANLSIFTITEIEGGETEVFNDAIAVTLDGVFALGSWVDSEKNNPQTWGTDSMLIDEADFERVISLQVPDSALSVSSLNGRYSVHSEFVEVGCTNGAVPESCTETYVEQETDFQEIIFNGNGVCTIPVDHEQSFLQITGNTLNKSILYLDDRITSANGIDNANTGSDWSITGCTYTVTGNVLAITMDELDGGETDSFTIGNLMLSSDAKYFKYAGGTITDNTYKEIPSIFGMKLKTDPVSNITGLTYLVSSDDFTDYDYNININNPTDPANDFGYLGNLSVYDARRYAITFDDGQGGCTLHQTHDFSMTASISTGELEMVTQESDINPSCSYIVVDVVPGSKKLKVTIDDGVNFARTFSARFSADYNVMKMNHKSVNIKGDATTEPDWDSIVYRATIATAFGVLLDGTYQTPTTAISNWVDPKYWVSTNNNASIIPIITSYLLF